MLEEKKEEQSVELPRFSSHYEPVKRNKVRPSSTMTPVETPEHNLAKMNFSKSKDCEEDEDAANEQDLMISQRLAVYNTPRAQDSNLSEVLSNKIETIKKTPIEYYDAVLYALNAKWKNQLNSSIIYLDCVRNIHHIVRLKREEDYLKRSELEEINNALSITMSVYSNIDKEYKIYGDALELISALAVKYGYINFDTLNYRHAERCNMIKMIDLQVLNSDIFTLETMWFCSMAEYPPIESISSNNVKQFAFVLKEISDKLICFLSGLNEHCDFNAVPSIFRTVAAKNPKIANYNSIVPDFTHARVPYQTVKAPKNRFNWCFKSEGTQKAELLRSLVRDFAKAYVSFEREFVNSMIEPAFDNSEFK